MFKLKALTYPLQFATVLASPYIGNNQFTAEKAYKLFYLRLGSKEKIIINNIMSDKTFANTFKQKILSAVQQDPFIDAFDTIKDSIAKIVDDKYVKLVLQLGRAPSENELLQFYKDSKLLNEVKDFISNYIPPTHSQFLVNFKTTIKSNIQKSFQNFGIDSSKEKQMSEIIDKIIKELRNDNVLFSPFATQSEFKKEFEKNFYNEIEKTTILNLFEKKLKDISDNELAKIKLQGINKYELKKQIQDTFEFKKNELNKIINDFKKNQSILFFDKLSTFNLADLKSITDNSLSNINEALQKIKPVKKISIKDLKDIKKIELNKLFPNWNSIENGILKTIERKNILIRIVKEELSKVALKIEIVNTKQQILSIHGNPIMRQVTIELGSQISSITEEINNMHQNKNVSLWNPQEFKSKTIDDIFTELSYIKTRYNTWFEVKSSSKTTIIKKQNEILREFTITIIDRKSKSTTTIIKKVSKRVVIDDIEKVFKEIFDSLKNQTLDEKKIKIGHSISSSQLETMFLQQYSGISNILKKYKDTRWLNATLIKDNKEYKLTITLFSNILGQKDSKITKTISLTKVNTIYNDFIKDIKQLQQSKKPYKSWKIINQQKLEYIFPYLKNIIEKYKKIANFKIPTISGELDLKNKRINIKIETIQFYKNIDISEFNTEEERFNTLIVPHLSPDYKGLLTIVNSQLNTTFDREKIKKYFPWVYKELSSDFTIITIELVLIKTNPNEENAELRLKITNKFSGQVTTTSIKIKKSYQRDVDIMHEKLEAQLQILKTKIKELEKLEKETVKNLNKKIIPLKDFIKNMEDLWNRDLNKISTLNQWNKLTTSKTKTRYEIEKYWQSQQDKIKNTFNSIFETLKIAGDWKKLEDKIREKHNGKIPENIIKKINEIPFHNIPKSEKLLDSLKSLSKYQKTLLIVTGSIGGIISIILIFHLSNMIKIIKRSKEMTLLTKSNQTPKVKLLKPQRTVLISLALTAISISITIWSIITALL
ncbi:MAG: hypothetical protein GY679_02930 [Mycoplasma sp.]|nr:hypothetical protein [Mycoplasma sp.]